MPAGGHWRQTAKSASQPQPNSRPTLSHPKPTLNKMRPAQPTQRINTSTLRRAGSFGFGRQSAHHQISQHAFCRPCQKPCARPSTSPSGMSAAWAASPLCGYGVRPPCVKCRKLPTLSPLCGQSREGRTCAQFYFLPTQFTCNLRALFNWLSVICLFDGNLICSQVDEFDEQICACRVNKNLT